MQTMRWLVTCGALLGFVALPLSAQTQTPPAADASKGAPKDASAKKTAPKDTAAKRAAPKKEAPKKAPPKDDKKKAASKKADDKTQVNKPMQSSKVPELRDEKGNVIPITPDAYDVSSALPGKSPPKKK